MSKPSFSFSLSLLLIFILVAPVVGQTRVGKLGIGVDGSMQTVLGAGSVSSSADLAAESIRVYLFWRASVSVQNLQ